MVFGDKMIVVGIIVIVLLFTVNSILALIFKSLEDIRKK